MSEWIPVSERLPVDIPHGYCLVTDGKEVGTANYDKTANKFNHCIDRDYWTPTHWMPMPEPPEVQAGDHGDVQLCDEAADEIERLLAEIAMLKDAAGKLYDIAASGAEPSPASADSVGEPVAYQAVDEYGRPFGYAQILLPFGKWPKSQRVALYRQPQPAITETERLAIEWAAAIAEQQSQAAVHKTLRALLERLSYSRAT